MPDVNRLPTKAYAAAAYAWLKLIRPVAANLPFNATISGPSLKPSGGGVTFDPLGVVAILHNNRADASAARLYAQRNGDLFRWPHTMMFGAVLTPVKVLVDHLAQGISTVHPATTMCQKDGMKLSVRTDMVFEELPLNFSNMWMEDVLAFLPSEDAANDIMVFVVPDMFPSMDRQNRLRTETFVGEPKGKKRSWFGLGGGEAKVATVQVKPQVLRVREKYWERFVLDVLGGLTGTMIVVGTVFSVLTGDMWAAVLFFLFLLHWLSSTLISFTSLIKYRPPGKIAEDSERKYALFERPGGAGTVVFTGRKDNIEKWARNVWEFDNSHESLVKNTVLHWSWVVTGTLSAIASVACMVNMSGTLQLGFLGLFVYSTLAEILASRIARNLQMRSQGGIVKHFVGGNKTRTEGIIRAALQGPKECRLTCFDERKHVWTALDWSKKKIRLLPDRREFVHMFPLLAKLASLQDGQDAEVEVAIQEYLAIQESLVKENDPNENLKLAIRITNEAREAWKDRNFADRKEATNSPVPGAKQGA